MHRLIVVLLLPVLMLWACDNVAGDPAATVEQYIQAKVEGDAEVIGQLLCSEMESDLQREVASFASVEARVEDMACERVGETDVVACDGAIVATYGTEDRDFPLVSYRVVQEDGEWRWCGEAD